MLFFTLAAVWLGGNSDLLFTQYILVPEERKALALVSGVIRALCHEGTSVITWVDGGSCFRKPYPLTLFFLPNHNWEKRWMKLLWAPYIKDLLKSSPAVRVFYLFSAAKMLVQVLHDVHTTVVYTGTSGSASIYTS